MADLMPESTPGGHPLYLDFDWLLGWWEEWKAAHPVTAIGPQVPAGELGGAFAGGEELVLNPDAEVPVGVITRLMRRPKFLETWNRTRKDLVDSSPSGYDMALSNFAVANGWSDQTAIDLCMHGRREANELNEQKIYRQDYWRRCLEKAHSAHDPKPEKVAPTPAPGPVAQPGETPEAMRARILAQLQAALDLEITGLIQTGSDNSFYSIVLAGDVEVAIGTADNLLQRDRFAAAVFDRAGHAIPHYSKKGWIEIANLLAAVKELRAIEDANPDLQLLDWVRAYAAGCSKVDSDDGLRDRLIAFSPFVYEGKLHINLFSFQLHLKQKLGMDHLTTGGVVNLLHRAGFVSRKMRSTRDDRGVRAEARYWAGDAALLEGNTSRDDELGG